MFCKYCGQEIDDNAVICPKCGRVLDKDGIPGQQNYGQNYGQKQQVYRQPASQKTNTLALVGFILSFFVPIVGLILSIIGKKQIKETGEGGNGLATAGIIISAIDLGFSLLSVIIYIAIYGSLMTAACSAGSVAAVLPAIL